MSTMLHLLAFASPWFLDMPVVVSNLLCALATFGTCELLNHVILLRHELYVPFETNRDIIVTAHVCSHCMLQWL